MVSDAPLIGSPIQLETAIKKEMNVVQLHVRDIEKQNQTRVRIETLPKYGEIWELYDNATIGRKIARPEQLIVGDLHRVMYFATNLGQAGVKVSAGQAQCGVHSPEHRNSTPAETSSTQTRRWISFSTAFSTLSPFPTPKSTPTISRLTSA